MLWLNLIPLDLDYCTVEDCNLLVALALAQSFPDSLGWRPSLQSGHHCVVRVKASAVLSKPSGPSD